MNKWVMVLVILSVVLLGGRSRYTEPVGEQIQGPPNNIEALRSDPAVLKVDGKYRMWFGANSGITGGVEAQQIYYAESLTEKGEQWKANEFPVVKISPNRWDAADIETPTVVKVDNTYHMLYAGRELSNHPDEFNPALRYRIGHATSQDGLTWVKDPKNPVISPKTGTFTEFSAVEPTIIHDGYVFQVWFVGASIKEGRASYQLGHAISIDGSNWTVKPHPFIPVDPVYTPEVKRVDKDKFMMYYRY